MIARISTSFNCTEEQLWKKIIKSKSLQFVASPVLSFLPAHCGELDVEWVAGKTYEMKLYLFTIIPAGRHTIRIVSIDRDSNTIQSNETGKLATVWKHTIRFCPAGHHAVHYTDEIEIGAGLLTLPVWLFAHLFYRHRQRRWKILLAEPDKTS